MLVPESDVSCTPGAINSILRGITTMRYSEFGVVCELKDMVVDLTLHPWTHLDRKMKPSQQDRDVGLLRVFGVGVWVEVEWRLS